MIILLCTKKPCHGKINVIMCLGVRRTSFKGRYKMIRGTKTNIIALLLSFMMVLVCFASDATIVTAHAEEMEECSLGEATCTEDAVGYSVDEEHVAGAVVKTQDVAGTKMYNWAYQVLDLINQERAKAGVAPLSMDVEMLERAMLRAAEINIVFDHTRPNGKSCFTAFNDLPAYGGAAGENIAWGYRSPESVVSAWMQSEGHRRNILNANYKSIGVGCFKPTDSSYCWTQIFGSGPATTTSARPADQYVVYPVEISSASDDLIVDSIKIISNDPSGIVMEAMVDYIDYDYVVYRWLACDPNNEQWFVIQDWNLSDKCEWTPDKYGNYVVQVEAMDYWDATQTDTASTSVEYHKYIKGKCQMPYTGEGGGYLIGFETYNNPNGQYRYEMLILDCTLLAEGKDAWIYTTGQCLVPETSFWTIWQPIYGYYWTLFRVYDADGNLLDEACYGFENIC
ncbi:MAG: hypothetical protein E7259_04395 [Lachnospiraceae bacterium]|nr:hypothetical protein [Lachnospiraceae bacterium]